MGPLNDLTADLLRSMNACRVLGWVWHPSQHRTVFTEELRTRVGPPSEGAAGDLHAVHVDDRQRVQLRRDELSKRPPAGEQLDRYRLIQRDSSPVHVLSTLRPVDDDAKDPVYRCILTDVTQEAALREDLSHSQSYGLLAGLAANIAHDFNNTLAVLQANIELLEMDQELMDEMLDAIARGSELASELRRGRTAQLRDFEVLDPKAFIQKAILDLDLSRPVAVQADGEPWCVRCDPRALHRAVHEIAHNAAAANGGALRVELQNRPGALDGIDAVAIVITDSGIGMSVATLGRAFEPLFSTTGGHGLGLYRARSAVAAASGRLTLESEPGNGTRATLLLPRVS